LNSFVKNYGEKMVKDKKALEIAQKVASATYFAITGASMKKTAGTKFTSGLTRKEIAKIAATEVYKIVAQDFSIDTIKAQPLGQYPIDAHSIGTVLQQKAPLFYAYITGKKYMNDTNVPTDLANFFNYVKSPVEGKEKWATEANMPQIIDAIASMIDPEVKEEFKTYLLSL
jgi:hypothetical protein